MPAGGDEPCARACACTCGCVQGYAPLLRGWEDFYTRCVRHACARVPVFLMPACCGRTAACITAPRTAGTGPSSALQQLATRACCCAILTTATLACSTGTRRCHWTRRILRVPSCGRQTGREKPCVNLGSYNYLGFADDWHVTCKDDVLEALDDYSPSMCSARLDAGSNRARDAEGVPPVRLTPRRATGNTALHEELEREVAEFVGKPAAICFNMGYLTNASAIPAIIGQVCLVCAALQSCVLTAGRVLARQGSLVVSDAYNHTSIVNGARASGATIRVFPHNGSAASV